MSPCGRTATFLFERRSRPDAAGADRRIRLAISRRRGYGVLVSRQGSTGVSKGSPAKDGLVAALWIPREFLVAKLETKLTKCRHQESRQVLDSAHFAADGAGSLATTFALSMALVLRSALDCGLLDRCRGRNRSTRSATGREARRGAGAGTAPCLRDGWSPGPGSDGPGIDRCRWSRSASAGACPGGGSHRRAGIHPAEAR
jgi:hypothetical protein